MKTLNYSEYLFSKLLALYDKSFAELEYDLQFSSISGLYEEFYASPFNDVKKGEYDCIISYLRNKYNRYYPLNIND